jgi:hypothetical protein
LTAARQNFRVDVYHENHPDGGYRMANRVQVFDPPSAISWEPGYYTDNGSLGVGGWLWRCVLAPAGQGKPRVTLTYDWSAVPDSLREHILFLPFAPEHLGNALAHLEELATS